MIHFAETLAVHSIEGFLTPDEVAELATLTDDYLVGGGRARFGGERAVTIHEIPGQGPTRAQAIYEPNGRVEVTSIPPRAEAILQDATRRALPAITRVLPSVTCCRPWTYVEYVAGQYITPHLDQIAVDPLGWPRQIAGISVTIEQAARGGGFFVETTSDRALWAHASLHPGSGYGPGMRLAHDGADHSSAWFRDMPRTRWTVSPPSGHAVLYGSQLAHGTEPVRAGRACKFISWLIAEQG